MDKPKVRFTHNSFIFKLIRVTCLVGIVLLAAGAVFADQREVQAKQVRAPIQQTEGAVQFRGVFTPSPSGQDNEYTIVEKLLYPALLISFENNSVSGSANISTSFDYYGQEWTAEASIDVEGTYDLETGVVEGTFDMLIKFRYPPDPRFHDSGEDVHYFGPFKSYYEDPATKFSLEDATVALFYSGMVATDRYHDNISDVSHSENQAAILINFVREIPDASDCTPSVYGLDPLLPGDVISPGATYTDQDGNDVSIIGERWFFNGQDANSVAWDGNPVTVELQWTCLGHQAHSQTFEIAAYQPPPPPAGEAPNQPASGEPASPGPGSGGLVNVLGGLLVGLGGVAGLGGLLGLGIPLIKVLTAAPAAVAVAVPAHAPAVPVNSHGPASPAPRPGKLDPSLKKPWEAKIDNLIDQRTAIQAQIQPINDQIIKLTRLYKNNILKIIMKGGLETGQILLDGATGGSAEIPNLGLGVAKKYLNDKAMDTAFQKHDTSSDGKTVVDVKNLIDNLKGQREGLRNQVKDVNREIKSIQTYIQNEF
jgi:hypothetical protein